MTELDELVAAARSLDDAPPPEAETRMWAAIAGAPALAPTAAATGAGGAAAATAGKAGSSLLLKITLGLVVAGGGATAAVVVNNPDRPDAPVVESTRVDRPTHVEPPKVDPKPQPAAVETAEIEPEPEPEPKAPRTRRTPPTKTQPNLAEETKLLRRAKVALSQGQAQTARKRLSEHKRKFPKGELIELRMALEVATLCALNREQQADAAAGRFLKRFPSSALAAKVRQRCAD